jgi:hypothetical protein
MHEEKHPAMGVCLLCLVSHERFAVETLGSEGNPYWGLVE